MVAGIRQWLAFVGACTLLSRLGDNSVCQSTKANPIRWRAAQGTLKCSRLGLFLPSSLSFVHATGVFLHPAPRPCSAAPPHFFLTPFVLFAKKKKITPTPSSPHPLNSLPPFPFALQKLTSTPGSLFSGAAQIPLPLLL